MPAPVSKRTRQVGEFIHKKFIPRKIPRYLPGSVITDVLLNDLKEFNIHREKVVNARPRIDCNPPRLVPQNQLRAFKMSQDIQALTEIQRGNRLLLAKINIINRTQGYTNTFNPLANLNLTKWRGHHKKMLVISKENTKMYGRITKQESLYSNKILEEDWNHNLVTMQEKARYPLLYFTEKSLDEVMAEKPDIYEHDSPMEALLRPKVFMEFGIDGFNINLGKIIIELYNDIVPETVELFLTFCRGCEEGSYRKQMLYKILQEQYFEIGDIAMRARKPRAMFCEQFPQENFVLRHTRPGVISLLNTDPCLNNLQFSITFDKYPAFDDVRVAFGKVIRGFKTLNAVQDLGKKKGRPSEKVIVTNCGVYEKRAS